MPWVKLDDMFADHPKIAEAGPLAGWFYVCGLCYAGRYLTDGFIPKGQVRKLADVDNAPALAARLVEVGLWEQTDGGYIIHDYSQYNPSAEQVKAQRERNAQRQEQWRRNRDGDAKSSNAGSNGVSNPVSATAPSPSPSPSPDPNPLETAVAVGADAPALPTPLTFTDWQERLQAASKKEAPGVIRAFMAEHLPRNEMPDYGYVNRAAAKVGGPGRLLDLLWQQVPRPPTGDALAYVMGIVRRSASDPPQVTLEVGDTGLAYGELEIAQAQMAREREAATT